MNYRRFRPAIVGIVIALFAVSPRSFAQEIPDEDRQRLEAGLRELNSRIEHLRKLDVDIRLMADIAVFAKGVDWCLRHREFHASKKKETPSAWIGYCKAAIETGLDRAKELQSKNTAWLDQPGSTIRGYVSKVDGSFQPYALSLPTGMKDAKRGYRWPLHVKLHGRGGTRNEVRFFNEHAGRKPQDEQTWIQLDVFGRTDNAYRWSGETDVFEAIKDVQRRYRIDERRITLWGFSMGGAGAWHLGLHHPSKWSSVGPGAGFVDFYEYQNQTEMRPPHQHKTLRIYDALDYALNMADVPVCTYGGELDKQLAASTRMVDRAKELGVPVKLLIGKGMGHRFHPDSFKDFMTIHLAAAKKGRPKFPGARAIRFVTYTLKYNRCEWLTIDELQQQYEAATVEGGVGEDGTLKLATSNIAALRIARDIAYSVELDGKRLPLSGAGDQLLPDVYFQREADAWKVLSYEESREFDGNPNLHKRHNLQGPIDDAFMEPFVCIRGTGTPWSPENNDWATWTLSRFEQEFDKWLRGEIPVIDDSDVTEEDIASKNLVLFGDPGSNAVMAKVIAQLPVKWTKSGLEVNGEKYDPASHGLSMIYPNPLNPQRYVVINSGHTMHEKDFLASNSWLFPRLGDIAVQKFSATASGYEEVTVWAELFDGSWKLPVKQAAPKVSTCE